MSNDEVNERFPLIKYKAWRTQRAAQGLPTEGGVNPTTSRPGSIRELYQSTEQTSGGHHASTIEMAQQEHAASSSTEARPNTARTSMGYDREGPNEKNDLHPTDTATTSVPDTDRNASVDDEADDEDDPIRAPAPPEMMSTPGDTCAICIDSLEDDEDVRGLTCGHAFHAACVDPWLTSRRACCPLCKADYYVPKPRPEGEAQSPNVPINAYAGPGRGALAFRPRMILAGPRLLAVDQGRNGNNLENEFGMRTPDRTRNNSVQGPQPQQASGGWMSRLRLGRRRNESTPADAAAGQQAAPTASPSQLEAGTAGQSGEVSSRFA